MCRVILFYFIDRIWYLWSVYVMGINSAICYASRIWKQSNQPEKKVSAVVKAVMYALENACVREFVRAWVRVFSNEHSIVLSYYAEKGNTNQKVKIRFDTKWRQWLLLNWIVYHQHPTSTTLLSRMQLKWKWLFVSVVWWLP